MKDKYTALPNNLSFSVQSGESYFYCFESLRDAEKAAELANEAYLAGRKSLSDEQANAEWPSKGIIAQIESRRVEAEKGRKEAIEFAECVRLMAKFEAKLAESKAKKTVNNWVEGYPPIGMKDEVEMQLIDGQYRTAKRSMTTQSNSLFFTDCIHSLQNAYCDQLMIRAWRVKSK